MNQKHRVSLYIFMYRKPQSFDPRFDLRKDDQYVGTHLLNFSDS